AYYYEVRERFNKYHEPLDFLFLNRSCFNGVIRFNRGGGFNTPFCRKPMRFSKSYITKIVNQVGFVYNLAQRSKWVFKCQDFRLTLSEVTEQDIVYCDPPYIGRHVDYYNGWSGSDETALFHQLKNCPANFILSTWHSNQHRDNPYITSLWSDFHQLTKEHFYHIGANKENRKPMLEALILNFVPEQIIQHETQARKILPLFQQNLVQ
ncbi:MAG: Dam family site-specific DNA-(adenine-N6)-methyltransferase, partial [Calditrichaeota bacterium]|nr:Dam family site-specific DNA-(adenine-N6)-methyltransferase [Calditrichota bacterium]